MKDFRFSEMTNRLRRSEIRELLKLTRMPDVISFGGGLPDPTIFPYEAIVMASEKTVRDKGMLALQYSPTEGEPFLREQLAMFMSRHGENARPDEVFVVSSSQQALDLMGKIFIDPGDPIIVEMPTYIGALQAFRSYGADFQGVEMDENGLIPELLEEKIQALATQNRKPKFIYLIPDFQNPSGVTLSLERRLKVLEIASKYDLLFIEDSPYRELRFTGETIPSLRTLDIEDRVVHLKTFSKMFCPGFRLGWVTGPKQVMEKMVIAKQGADLCTSAFVSYVAGYFIKDGHLEGQIEKSRMLYSRKCHVMVESLEKHMPKLDGLSWFHPEGGVFLWVKLPVYMDSLRMLMEAVDLADRDVGRVAYVAGSGFYHDDSGKNTMRLNFSYPSAGQIRVGIKRLAELVNLQAENQLGRLKAIA